MGAWIKEEEDTARHARRRARQRDWESCYRTRKRRILRSDTTGLADESKQSLCGRETGRGLRNADLRST